ncbi:MAG: PKD domain-containing protein, partial [Flavobacteriales bacterium]|nr:PKD domain-containing protein [Flavobacteriales bacterium]
VGTASVDSVTGNSGGDTYYWVNFNGDTIASGVGVISVSGLAGGTYSVSIEDGITGCITSAVVIISQPSPLNTAIFPTNIIDVSCNGLCDGSLTVNASGGTGAYTYSWLPTSTDVTPMADSLCGGQHIVFVTDADGCIDSSVATIGDPPAINVIATVTDVSCFGNNDGIIDLVPTPTGGTPPYAYVWLPSGIAGNVQTATNLAAGTDTVITTDLNGCTETTIVTVTEPAELLFTDVTVPDFCGSAQGQATVTPSGGTPAYTYAWNTNPPQADSNAIGLLAGTYIVTVSDANGCTKSGPVTVPGTPGPIIDSAIVINVGCNGDATGSATVLVTSGTLPFTYVWDDPALQSTQTATGLLAGQFICTVTDVTGCQDIAVVTVVEPPPIVVLMFADPYSLICFGESVVISTVILGGVNPVVRAWDHGLPDSSAHLVSPIVTDTFNVFISDANGCQDTGSIKITVSPPLVVTATPLIEICIGQSAILWARPSAGNGGPYTVIWDDGITTTTVSVNAGDSTSITVSPLVNTSYTVVVTDSCSLNDTAYAFVAITELPDVIFSSAQSTGCDITFTDQSVAYSSLGPPNSIYIDTWEWDFGDGTGIGPGSGTVIGSPTTSGTYTNPTHQYVADGVYDVTVTIVDIKGCTSTMTITAMITVSAPQANFSYDPITVIKDQIIQFTDLSTGNIIGWSWNFGDTLGSGSSLQNPTHVYTDTGSYDVLLAVIDSNGCVDTIIRTITVTDQLVIYVPNIFAPDDQNQSQMLYVSGIGITSLNFIIYDRWGEKVFESTTATPRDRPDGKGNWYGEGWDGTMNGKEMSAQVFVYYLEADLQDGESVIKKGNITLIR